MHELDKAKAEPEGEVGATRSNINLIFIAYTSYLLNIVEYDV
jgi:hypothetical protein